MKEIEAGIIKETAKFIESLSSMIVSAIAKEIIGNKTNKRSVVIYK